MNRYRRISSPWSQFALFMLLLGAGLLVAELINASILITMGAIKPGQTKVDPDNPALIGTAKLLQGIASVVVFLVPSLLYAIFSSGEKPLYFLGFRKPGKTVFYILALALVLFSFPLEEWLGQLNQGIRLPASLAGLEKDQDQQITAFLKADSSMGILLNIFLMAVLPAICEEVCFRGALQRILIRLFKSPWAGIIVTAIFFSAIHLQFQGFLPRMFLGILLGALYWYSGSLWIAILAHFLINGVDVIVLSLNPKSVNDNISVPVYAVLISMVIVVGLLSEMRRRSVVSYAKEYGTEIY